MTIALDYFSRFTFVAISVILTLSVIYLLRWQNYQTSKWLKATLLVCGLLMVGYAGHQIFTSRVGHVGTYLDRQVFGFGVLLLALPIWSFFSKVRSSQ